MLKRADITDSKIKHDSLSWDGAMAVPIACEGGFADE